MIFLQTVGLVLIIGVFALLLAATYKILRQIKRIYTRDSGNTDLDLTKKQ